MDSKDVGSKEMDSKEVGSKNGFEPGRAHGTLNLNRSYLPNRWSKCYEIFTEAYIHIEECSHQISPWLDISLIDSNQGSNRSWCGPGPPDFGRVGPLTCLKRSSQILGEISASYAYKWSPWSFRKGVGDSRERKDAWTLPESFHIIIAAIYFNFWTL